ncbi:hypothetical protein ACI65C_006747 [Semiaphis heraclei]
MIPISYYVYIHVSEKMNSNIRDDDIEQLIFDFDLEPYSDYDDTDDDPNFEDDQCSTVSSSEDEIVQDCSNSFQHRPVGRPRGRATQTQQTLNTTWRSDDSTINDYPYNPQNIQVGLNPDIIDALARCAAQKIASFQNLSPHSTLRAWYDTDIGEIKNFLGVVLWMGLVQLPSYDHYWSTYAVLHTNIGRVMSRNRFEIIMQMIHFIDNEQADKSNRLYKLGTLVEDLTENYNICYIPEESLCIAESVIPFMVERLTIKESLHPDINPDLKHTLEKVGRSRCFKCYQQNARERGRKTAQLIIVKKFKQNVYYAANIIAKIVFLMNINLKNESKTCPHCRSSVLENNLVKLFLQVDPSASEVRDRKTDEELNSLKEQLKSLKDTETRNNILETQLKDNERALEISNRSVMLSKRTASNIQNKLFNITANLRLQTVRLTESEIDRKKFKAGYLLLQSKIKSLNHELYDLQSSNSSYIDKLKSEIANLKSEKLYFQSRCYTKVNMNIEQPSTSKMNIENKNAVSLQNQTKIEYYGHDPQLHLSTKQFLLGCVFLFVEAQIQQEDNNTTLCKNVIIKYGGSVEQLYSDRVTHVICVTQKHHTVEQGINDGKRCVTYYWLSDIMSKKRMIPPWLAVHFPIPYSIENLPCLNFQFLIVNFGTNEHQIIKTMIDLVGGDHVTKEVTSRTDIVVSLKLEGELVEKALAINKPVVNVQWLNEILFGARIGIREPGNLKYQQFDLSNPFSVNYDMVSHLMEAWKTPLRFLEIQQVHDSTSNPNTSSKRKRQKIISETQEIVINDDIGDNDVIITYVKNVPSKPCVMFCGFSAKDKELLKMMILFFGGIEASHYFEATHLIMNEPVTSIEFFGCLSTVKYVLNANWLKDSRSSLKLLDEKQYFIEIIQDQHLGLYNVPEILEKNSRHLLFKHLTFFVTPGITYPPSLSLTQIISSAGGTIERTRRSLESIRDATPNSYFIISCQEDNYFYNDLLGIYNVVYLPEFITYSILMQHVQLQNFLLEVTAQN